MTAGTQSCATCGHENPERARFCLECGASIAHEDQAQRACFTALHLLERLRDYGRQVRREHGLDFATRIGLNSDEVVVGRIGDDLRMDYTAQGHTVGLAQRIEDLGVFNLKGVSEPLTVFRLAGVGTARERLDPHLGKNYEPKPRECRQV